MRHRRDYVGFWTAFDAVVHSMKAVDHGHMFRLAYLRKYWDTHMHGGDIFALDVTAARQRFNSGHRRNGRDRDGSGNNRDNYNTARPAREAAAPRSTFAKGIIKDYGKGKAKAEASTTDKAE
eukprot:jgi/Tetstr1/422285/TSEL_013129.t1